MYMEETWILPKETKTKDKNHPESHNPKEAQVIRNTLGRVLEADSQSKSMRLKQFFTVEIY